MFQRATVAACLLAGASAMNESKLWAERENRHMVNVKAASRRAAAAPQRTRQQLMAGAKNGKTPSFTGIKFDESEIRVWSSVPYTFGIRNKGSRFLDIKDEETFPVKGMAFSYQEYDSHDNRYGCVIITGRNHKARFANLTEHLRTLNEENKLEKVIRFCTAYPGGVTPAKELLKYGGGLAVYTSHDYSGKGSEGERLCEADDFSIRQKRPAFQRLFCVDRVQFNLERSKDYSRWGVNSDKPSADIQVQVNFYSKGKKYTFLVPGYADVSKFSRSQRRGRGKVLLSLDDMKM